jgi:hypothetical protein
VSGDFWTDHNFDFDDLVNKDIHDNSPFEQLAIQPMSALASPGSIGAQQAMLDDLNAPLPWVQDIVGTRSKEPGSIVVIGSAYAPFIQGISNRKTTLPLASYVSLNSSDFQRNFLQFVVRPDADYYAKVSLLCRGTVESSQMTVFDLCRASYAIRGMRVGRSLDRGAEFTFKSGKCKTLEDKRVANENARRSREMFIRYVDSEKQREWTRRRFTDSQATNIMALGYRAEHGLLRFFFDLGIRDIAPHRAPNEKWAPDRGQEDRWLVNYARNSLETWLIRTDWWDIKGALGGQERTWRLLPVLHPSRNVGDSTYERTRTVFSKMIRS